MATPPQSKQININKLIETPQTGVIRLDRNFAIVAIDDEIEALLLLFLPVKPIKQAVGGSHLCGKQWLDIIGPLQTSPQGTPWLQANQTQSDQTSLLKLINNQIDMTLSLRYSPVFDHHSNLLEMLIFIVVAKSKQQIEKDLKNEQAFYRAVVDDMPALIYRYTTEGIVTLANAAVCSYFGAKADEIIGMSIYDVMDAENIDRAKNHLASITAENPILAHEHSGTDSVGNRKWFQWTDRLILSDDGQPLGYQGIGLDLTERKMYEEELLELASTDMLTGLLNRRQCILLGKQALLSCRQENHSFSLLIIDLDLFKNVNDSLGHLAGDHVLQKFAALCTNILDESNIIGRYGGEEFIIMLPKTNLKQALVIGENLRKKVETMEISLDKHQFNITISVGIAASNDSLPNSLNSLLASADEALYKAKATGRNKVAY
jgi:diguanylate cyclase (GGDEF)-like protein/PAS domain S-box-containing protein